MSATLRLAIILTIAVLALAAPGNARADDVRAAGHLDGAREDVAMADVTLSINGAPVALDAKGAFDTAIAAAPYYRLDIGGEGVFASVQTFGHQELRDPACDCLTIPSIELVARKPGRIELFFAGDAMAGRRYLKPIRGMPRHIRGGSVDGDLDALLAPMKPYIETADIASVNLETVLAHEAPAQPMPKRIVFHSVPQLAGALKRAGFDYVTLGNNHIFDYRDAGVDTTFDYLKAADLPHSGAGYNAQEALAARHFAFSQQRLAMMGVVSWIGSQEAHQAATETKGGAGLGHIATIREIVDRERRDGAVPILQYHGGGEYSMRPSDTTYRRLRIAAERGSPVVIGHHPHVTQGLEIYSGALIAYSIGNYMFDQNYPETMPGYVLKVWLDGKKFHRAEVIPIMVLDYRPVPAVGAVREYVLRRVMSLSEELDTKLVQSGGHAAVTRGDHTVSRKSAACGSANIAGSALPLGRFCGSSGAGIRLGKDLLPGGDFENSRFGVAKDRRWNAEGADIAYDLDGGMNRLLRLSVTDPDEAYLFTRSYLRDVDRRTVTVQFDIRTAQPVSVELLVKPKPEKGAPAGKRWAGARVASQALSGGDGWQRLEFAFHAPLEADGDIRDFRPIVKLAYAEQDAGKSPLSVEIDNLELTGWEPSVPGKGSRSDWIWNRAEQVASTEASAAE